VPVYQRERQRLADTLKLWRAAASLSGAELAARLGWQQPKISKIERGRQLPAEEDIRAWGVAAGVPDEEIAALIAALPRARVEYVGWKDAYRAIGGAGVQAEIRAHEISSTRIAEFQPAIMPGLLQTRDYARELLSMPCGSVAQFGSDEPDVEGTVAERELRQEFLYSQDKQVDVIMLEAALRTVMVPVPVLAAQLIRLIDLVSLPTAEIGIIPFAGPLPVWPISGFRLYDDLVVVESQVGEQQLSAPEEIARYGKYLEWLRDAALTGEAAVPVIRDALAALQ
jgi:transcriptional regulator with XRE-family HTH domain